MADSGAVRSARYYAAHREQECVSAAAYRAANPEKRRILRATYYAAHREQECDYGAHYRASTAGILAVERGYQKSKRRSNDPENVD